MNFNNSRLVDHKPMKFGTFVPYMYRFVIIVKYLTNFFKLEWNLGINFTLRFFFLSVYLNRRVFVMANQALCYMRTTTIPISLRFPYSLTSDVSICHYILPYLMIMYVDSEGPVVLRIDQNFIVV